MGMGGDFWDGDIHASFDARLEGTGLSSGGLPASGEPIQMEIREPEERGFLKKGFETPTGKVEFVSTILEGAGCEGLPLYREPHWSPVSTPDLAKDFPLVLTSGARSRTYTHSQGRQLETLRSREPEPKLQMSPADAVSAPHGWTDADVNLLIPDSGLDPISGFPPFKSSLCQVYRVGDMRPG
jgi:anaerobic selenocysteine-containing dehydrogenase